MPQTQLFPEDTAPHQGLTAATRAASASGARAAAHQRALKIDRVRRLWRQPHTMQEIKELSGYELSTVCSLRACLGLELAEVSVQERTWPSGRVTRRVVLQLAALAPKPAQGPSEAPQ